MAEISRHGFQLGDKYISPLEGRITGPGGTEHVQPKVMDVLVCLARRAGEVVERDQIFMDVWGDPTVNDVVLTHCISDLRHLLGDSGEGPEYIRTIPKRGYQLIAPVNATASPPLATTTHQRATIYSSAILAFAETLRRRRVFRAVGVYAIFVWLILQVADVIIIPLGIPPWAMTVIVWFAVIGFPVTVLLAWTLQITEQGLVVDESEGARVPASAVVRLRSIDYVIAVSLLLIMGILAFQLATTRDSGLIITTDSGQYELPRIDLRSISRNSIAVMPFVNLGADPEGKYLGLGLAEEVLNLLANIRELKVPSRQLSFRYQDGGEDLHTIAKELRVRNILEGSVQGDGNEMRITAQLIDADTGYHLWSKTYKRQNTNMLLIRDEIAQAVVDSLRIVLSVESQQAILEAPTRNVGAYDYYLLGLSYLRQPKTEETLANAHGRFTRALELDPGYAKAHAGICEVKLGTYLQYNETRDVAPAQAACEKALQYDPNTPEVHTALGELHRLTGHYDEARRDYERAIERNPRLEPAFYGLGRVYMALDRLDDAEGVFLYAVDLEPGYWGTHLALGNYYLEFGNPEKAIAPFRRVTELRPDYAMGYNNLGSALYNSGDIDRAEEAFLRSIDIEPTNHGLSNIGTMYYNTGRFEQAADMYEQAIDVTPKDFTLWGRLAAAMRHVGGQDDDSRRNFQTAIELAETDLAVNPNSARTLRYIASYYANVGDEISARAAIERALEIGPNDPDVHYFAAHVEIALDNEEAALSEIERAAELGYSVVAIESDPDFEPLHTNLRFIALIN